MVSLYGLGEVRRAQGKDGDGKEVGVETVKVAISNNPIGLKGGG